jgi:hypothetical protein
MPSRAARGSLILGDGTELPCDECLWCTGAAAPAWLRDCGLPTGKRARVGMSCADAPFISSLPREPSLTLRLMASRRSPAADADGFLAVRDTLQSEGRPEVSAGVE